MSGVAPVGSPAFQYTRARWQAEGRGVFVFVFGRDEAEGFVLVAGLEGFLFAGVVVFVVKDAPRPEEYAVSLFHVIFHVMTMNQLDLTPLASSGRVRFGVVAE